MEASEDLESWAELDDSVDGQADSETTDFTESPLPEGVRIRYYRVLQQ